MYLFSFILLFVLIRDEKKASSSLGSFYCVVFWVHRQTRLKRGCACVCVWVCADIPSLRYPSIFVFPHVTDLSSHAAEKQPRRCTGARVLRWVVFYLIFLSLPFRTLYCLRKEGRATGFRKHRCVMLTRNVLSSLAGWMTELGRVCVGGMGCVRDGMEVQG